MQPTTNVEQLDDALQQESMTHGSKHRSLATRIWNMRAYYYFLHCTGMRQRRLGILFGFAVMYVFLGISLAICFVVPSRGQDEQVSSSQAQPMLLRQGPLPSIAKSLIATNIAEGEALLVPTTEGRSTYSSVGSNFTAIPHSSLHIACIAKSQTNVIRAFQQRGWGVVRCADTHQTRHREMRKCAIRNGRGVILWTKHEPIPSLWNTSQPWQRHNWLPVQSIMSNKGKLLRALKKHSRKTGLKLHFLPDSYVLPLHRKSFLNRMLGTGQKHDNVEKEDGDGSNGLVDGFDVPWVLKLGGTDNGNGIAMLGPNGDGLHMLVRLLQSSSRAYDSMSQIREQLVFAPHVNDTRSSSKIKQARKRSAQLNDDIIIQQYVCNELDYFGHKFDLRVYYLIASVNPLIVLYHDGTLRVALSEYNATDFSSTGNHLTNIGRNRLLDNCTASFADWEVTLRAHVAAAESSFSQAIRENPLLHIRKQIMDALANVVASVRDASFHGYGSFTRTENGFALMGGDFIVDRGLNVWLTEAQSSPGLGHATPTRREMYDRLLPSVVDILNEVMEKESRGEPLLPLRNVGDFELIYTENFQYQYDFARRLERVPC
jgi:Tubulin-tyrosine ligase family